MKSKNTKQTIVPLETVAIRWTTWIGSIQSLIVHTIAFVVFFILGFLGVAWDTVFLILTTIVSLEAIYLAIFIQMSVNRNTASLEEVEEDIEEIQQDIDEIQEDVDEIAEDVDEIAEDVDEIQEDVDEWNEEDELAAKSVIANSVALETLHDDLQKLLDDLAVVKQNIASKKNQVDLKTQQLETQTKKMKKRDITEI